MASALSLDLRKRIIARWKQGNITVDDLADAFMVGRATVVRLMRLERETGSVEPKPRGGGKERLIGPKGEAFIRRLIERNRDWTTYELADVYNEWAKTRVSRSTVLRALKRLGYTIKKSASSPWSERPNESSSGTSDSENTSQPSPLRVWFLWTKPARTSR
jgi:transposase